MSDSRTPTAWPDVLSGLLRGEDLTEEAAAAALTTIVEGQAQPAEIAGFLVALRAKGEAEAEIAGFVRTLVEHALPIAIDGPLLDTCGTGGDGAGTFNISTVTALVCAAAGVRVAKHGNRAASGVCGSADLLEAWGVEIELPAPAVARTIDELGIGFLYARAFHPAMRHVAPVRAQLGIRTVFNVLGPLANPAGAEHQVVGVADARLAPVMAGALGRLGKRHALVFRSEDGLDELTTTGPSQLWEVRDGHVEAWRFDPAELGLPRAALADLVGGSVEDNVRIAEAVLSGEPGPATEVVALNAGAGLYVADHVPDIGAGLARARDILASGAARELKDRWADRTKELAAEHGGA